MATNLRDIRMIAAYQTLVLEKSSKDQAEAFAKINSTLKESLRSQNELAANLAKDRANTLEQTNLKNLLYYEFKKVKILIEVKDQEAREYLTFIMFDNVINHLEDLILRIQDIQDKAYFERELSLLRQGTYLSKKTQINNVLLNKFIESTGEYSNLTKDFEDLLNTEHIKPTDKKIEKAKEYFQVSFLIIAFIALVLVALLFTHGVEGSTIILLITILIVAVLYRKKTEITLSKEKEYYKNALINYNESIERVEKLKSPLENKIMEHPSHKLYNQVNEQYPEIGEALDKLNSIDIEFNKFQGTLK
tara:strand:+ start:9193 stop:10107 length:915 start_codon:yes stop_codon:yes gene_type:complete